MKEVSFLSGEQIIREGDDGDCQALVFLSAMLARSAVLSAFYHRC